jgi:sugar/nucleoside kinase (ribokinase family)
MSKIYGFGNALIDVEISITDEELTSLNINKGSMVHISSEQKNVWLKEFRKNIVSRQPGGSIANSLYAASSEHSICTFSCSLGNDEESSIFIDGFKGTSTQVVYQYSKKPTGVCFIFVTPDGERTMASNLSANEDLSPKCLNAQELAISDWLVFDAFSVCTKNGLKTAEEALKIAKKNDLRIAFGLADINLVEANLKEINWVIEQPINLLVGNNVEIGLLRDSTKLELDILWTLGAKGSRFNQILVDADSVSIVNTNGAGDALLGVFLSHIDMLNPKDSLKKAVDYATKVCLVGGPRI